MSDRLVPIPFKSKMRRVPDPVLETEASVLKNDDFEVLFRFSEVDHRVSKEKHLVVLVNGFAEGNSDLYHRPQIGLADLLSARGVATALLPIPYHLGRVARTPRMERLARRFVKQEAKGDGKGGQSESEDEPAWGAIPSSLVKLQPERLYVGYRQLVSDVAKLVREVKGLVPSPEGVDYTTWFDAKNTKVHLLGYSLGGLACLAVFLKQRVLVAQGRESDPLFETCCLLSSGSNFLDLVPKSLGFGERVWDKVRAYYYTRHFERKMTRVLEELRASPRESRRKELESEMKRLEIIKVRDSLSYRFFEELVLGVWNPSLLERVSNRVIAILGMSDPVVRPDTIFNVRPRDRRFTAIHLPALSHEIVNTECWKQWCHFVGDCLLNFFENHPPDVFTLETLRIEDF